MRNRNGLRDDFIFNFASFCGVRTLRLRRKNVKSIRWHNVIVWCMCTVHVMTCVGATLFGWEVMGEKTALKRCRDVSVLYLLRCIRVEKNKLIFFYDGWRYLDQEPSRWWGARQRQWKNVSVFQVPNADNKTKVHRIHRISRVGHHCHETWSKVILIYFSWSVPLSQWPTFLCFFIFLLSFLPNTSIITQKFLTILTYTQHHIYIIM